MIIMFWYFTLSRIRNPRVHWFCSHCYYFNGIRSNSLNIFVTWENCQYFTRRNQNIRTIKRNLQTLHSPFLLIFLTLKLSSLNSYLSSQYISNSQFSWWPAIPKLLTSDYADCIIIIYFWNANRHSPQSSKELFSNSLKWYILFCLSLAALQSCPELYG